MVGLLLITHEPLGAAMLACAAHVYRRQPENMAVIDVVADEDPESVLRRAAELLPQLHDGAGVLVLTDMLGATPCNIASRLPFGQASIAKITDVPVRIVSGMNLPMLLRALCYRDLPLDEVTAKAIEGGRNAIDQVGCGE